MASHHTGYNELITIESEEVSISIKGVEKQIRDYGKISTLNISCLQEVQFDSYHKPDDINHRVIGISHIYSSKTKPMFYEQTSYEVIIISKNNHRIDFWHDNPEIRNSITSLKEVKDQRILTGIINFKNEIGLSDLSINVEGKEYIKITIEVFPSKIDYVEDYKAIMEDVTAEVYNLAFDFLRKTYSEYNVADKQQSSQVEFYTIIKRLFEQLVKACDVILGAPHHILESTHELQYNHKIKRTDHQSIRWLEKHPEQTKVINGKVLANKTLGVKKQITYNTRENQYTKFMLQNTLKRLNNFKFAYLKMEGSRSIDQETIKQIDLMIQSLHNRIRQGFMNEVDTLTSLNTMSLVFSMSPGYRDLYKYYLMLSRGLSVTGELFHVSMKDLAKLYEYWCFIKLNSILKEKYKLQSQDIIKTRRDGIFVQLDTNKKSTVKYKNPINGEVISLAYNQAEREGPTVNQKPDNVLSLKKKGSSIDYEFVFDAKYKIDNAVPDTYYGNKYKTPGPKEEDINTMHRYRDAIVGNKDPWRRNMFGAYVLFPYGNEEEYQNHKFYKSINEVNIGALPFLPSATGLVSKLLEELIYDTPDAAFNRSVLPVGIDEKIKEVDWSKKDVLIANVDTQEDFNIIYKTKEYLISMNEINDDDLPIRYIAINQKDVGIQWYGEVIRNRFNRNHDTNEMFYVYEVGEWKTINIEYSKIVINYANSFMLEKASTIIDLKVYNERDYETLNLTKRNGLDEFIKKASKEISVPIIGDLGYSDIIQLLIVYKD